MTPRRDAAVWVATAFGAGRSPWAPGTVGSAVGLLLGWWAASWMGNPAIRWLAAAIGFLATVAICSRAEQALGQTDPPAVVLDEVWAMASILLLAPPAASSWPWTAAAFVLFRFFDVVKPPPIKRLGDLPAGWGIAADDLGAAAYTLGVLLVLHSALGR